ncbi:methyltransferase-like protein 10 [Fopius arisanus]|uniref:Protein-lysine N-methyltransferase LOC105263939 n=1 Tax=Fopius arisanus TaxID=64838 RepID=A0A9R1SX97_9HYME|nr:PREDICTED: methyltransferase-like protein 10 [Fopius arisanus]XP_011298774.1 PREDICTED: methyltransferase-like protein 10 [Fopius arisanus]
MGEELEQDLNSSELGTKEYWEKIYSEEIDNFEDHGDVGEVWFGKNNAVKMVRCISEDLSLSRTDKILDIGCGNGWTLVQLSKAGFTDLVGVDYAPSAINLARAVLEDNQVVPCKVHLMVGDILNTQDNLFLYEFRLIHDKGTYDAISLSPDNSSEKRHQYVENVHKILGTGGYLVISSCNWTQEELVKQFENYFDVALTIAAPVMKFGGKIGQSVTNIVFKKK